jgi:hypothetical protein
MSAKCREKIQERRRHRLRHHGKAGAFGGAGGAACLARLRAVPSQILTGALLTAAVPMYLESE